MYVYMCVYISLSLSLYIYIYIYEGGPGLRGGGDPSRPGAHPGAELQDDHRDDPAGLYIYIYIHTHIL